MLEGGDGGLTDADRRSLLLGPSRVRERAARATAARYHMECAAAERERARALRDTDMKRRRRELAEDVRDAVERGGDVGDWMKGRPDWLLVYLVGVVVCGVGVLAAVVWSAWTS